MPKDVAKDLIQRHDKAVQLFQDGEHRQAMTIATEVVRVARVELGERHPFLEACLSTLGQMHESLAELDKAEPLYAEALEIRRFTAGIGDPSLFQSLNRLARIRLELGDSRSAQSLTRESIEICEKALGADNEAMVGPLNIQAQVHLATGKPREALEVLRRALMISEETTDNDVRASRVLSMTLMGDAALALHQVDDAEESYTSALDAARQMFGAGHPNVVRSLEKLADFCQAHGQPRKAEACRQEVAGTVRSVVGDRSPEYAERLAGLASARHLLGRADEARRLFDAAERILLAAPDPYSPSMAMFLVARGNVAAQDGRWSEAQAYFTAAAGLLRAFGDAAEAVLAEVFERLGAVLLARGQGRDAFAAQEQAVQVHRRLTARGPQGLLGAVEALASIAYRLRDFETAEALAREALEISEAIDRAPAADGDADDAGSRRAAAAAAAAAAGEAPADSFKTANLCGLLGSVLMQRGRRDEALRLLRRGEARLRELVGDDHPDYAGLLRALASDLALAGRDGDAVALLQQHLAITLADLRRRARSAAGVTWTIELDVVHDTLAELITIALGGAAATTDADPERDPAARPAVPAPRQPNPRLVAAALTQVLRVKAAALDALGPRDTDRLARLHPMQARLVRAVADASARLAAHLDDDPRPGAAPAYRRRSADLAADLRQAEEQLEAELPDFAEARRRRSADAASVAAALPPGSALVEFVRYHPIDLRALERELARLWQPPRYAAFVVRAGEDAAVTGHDLGPAADVDARLDEFLAALARGEDARGPGEALRALLLDPLAGRLAGVGRLIIAPDGQLSRLPFDALPAAGGADVEPDALLIDRCDVQYVITGGDLLRPVRRPTGEALIVADPDVDLPAPPAPRSDALDPAKLADRLRPPGRLTRWFRWLVAKPYGSRPRPGAAGDRVRLEAEPPAPAGPLVSVDARAALGRPGRDPSTMDEARAVAATIPGPPAKVLAGAEATAERLAAAGSPRLLHLAAPCFVLPDPPHDPNDWLDLGLVLPNRPRLPDAGPEKENPHIRAGLLLAGAADALAGRAGGAPAGFGLFTGLDAAALDLTTTDLVVLSRRLTDAQVPGGRALTALIGSFLAAGSRHVAAALLPAPPAATRALLEGVYQRLAAGAPARLAFREARLERRRAAPRDPAWAGFALYGPAA